MSQASTTTIFLVASLMALGCFQPNCMAQSTIHLARNDSQQDQVEATNVLMKAYAKAGLNVEIKPLPPNRAQLAMAEGEVDGEVARTFDYFQTRPKLIVVGPPVHRDKLVVVARRDHETITADQIRKGHVAALLGLSFIEKWVNGATTVTLVPTPDQMYAMLVADHVEYVLDTKTSAEARLKGENFSDFGIFTELEALEFHHVLDQRFQAEAKRLAAELSQVVSSVRP